MNSKSTLSFFWFFGRTPSRWRRLSLSTLCCVALAGWAAPGAKADAILYYAFSNQLLTAPASSGNWTLTDFGGLPGSSGAGTAISPDAGTIILTGINDGSFVPGWTELAILAAGNGTFQFDYSFSTPDDPHYQFAGYLLNGSLTRLADEDGHGSVSVPVLSGELIGFYAGGDDQGGLHGTLTITGFSAPLPVPEPGAFGLLLMVCVVAAAARWRALLRHRLMRLGAVVAAFLSCSASAQQVYYTGTNVTGALALAGAVNLPQRTNALAVGERVLRPDLVESERRWPAIRPLGEKLKIFSPRLQPSNGSPPSPAADILAPMAAASGASPLTILPGSGGSGFNALSHLDQRLANNGNQFSIEPPSPSVAAGNGFVLEGVNDAIQVYDVSGSPMLPAVLTSNQLFGLAPAINRTTGAYGVYLTDMHVHFDSAINRWLVMQWEQDNDKFGNPLPASHLYLAVSQGGDPTAGYNIYVMNTTNSANPSCPCLPDYPQFGADQFGLHISWDEYNVYTHNFVDAVILTVSKTSLASGAVAPAAFRFQIPYVSGFEFSIRPSITPSGAANAIGNGGLQFFASTYSALSLANQIAVWAMFDTSSLATPNPSLTLVRISVPVLSYSTPNVATQRAGAIPYGSSQSPPAALEYLDGGDTRVQSLSYAAGFLHLTLPTSVTDGNGNLVIGGAYVVLSPTYRGGLLAARVINQGYVFVKGNHLLRPAVAVNAQGTGAIAATLVGVDWYPSAAYVPFNSLSTPTVLQVAAAGTLPEDGFTGYASGGGYGVARWGDYNSAIAAADGSIWMAVEYIGNYPRTDYANWNTYIIHTAP